MSDQQQERRARVRGVREQFQIMRMKDRLADIAGQFKAMARELKCYPYADPWLRRAMAKIAPLMDGLANKTWSVDMDISMAEGAVEVRNECTCTKGSDPELCTIHKKVDPGVLEQECPE